MRITTAFAAFATAMAPSTAWAVPQCPDGAPPPCLERRPDPDPRRIVILPFRVTSADTALGQGIAEVVSAEFTGQGTPLAVHMGTVLRAWRRAGGTLVRPLSESGIQRIGRELNAGTMVEGTVVGLGSRISISAWVRRGAERRRIGPLSAPGDSVEQLLGRLASALLENTGSNRPARTRLSDRPEATLAYLGGMVSYRRGLFREARASFQRALLLDSSFAAPALMGLLSAGWAGNDEDQWKERAWRLRDRLSPEDRLLLEAVVLFNDPSPPTLDTAYAVIRHAAAVLPESPEAQYVLGDYLFHSGSHFSGGIADDFAPARAALERSLALDSQATSILHLVEIAFLSGDTVLLRQLLPALENFEGNRERLTAVRLIAAELRGDTSLTPRLGRAGPEFIWMALEAGLPAGALRRIFGPLNQWALHLAGRSAEARETAATAEQATQADMRIVLLWLMGEMDSASAARAAAGLRTAAGTARPSGGLAGCALALWDMRHQRPAAYQPSAGQHTAELCAQLIALLEAERNNAADLTQRLNRFETELRFHTIVGRTAGYEYVLLAQLFERLGQRDRALQALRFRTSGTGVPYGEPAQLRMEGRLAAELGDTAAAVRLYRRYLRWRRDAEPPLAPLLDSTAAALARLQFQLR